MDRKGIIGLLICGLLLAAHFHYSAKNAQAERLKELANQKERVEELPGEAESGGEGDSGIGELEAGDNVERVPEREIRLETEKIIFVLTTHGGGVKYAQFKEQKAVGRDDELVTLNRFGDAAVGTLVEGGVDRHLDLEYTVLEEEEGRVAFGATTPEGLKIVKRWWLSDGNREVDEYLLKLKVTIQNAAETGSVDLGGYGLHAGSAAPLHPNEDVQGTGFFSYSNGLKFERPTWFAKGMFREARPNYEKSRENVTYAGVSNQFFSTMLSVKEGWDSTIWARSGEVELEEASGGGEKKSVRMAWSFPKGSLKAGQVKTLDYEVFMGPKDNKVVRELGAGRGDVMHYGFFAPISRLLNWLLNFYHDHVFDRIARSWAWGFAIILVTFTIRLIIWPLHNASTKTMKRMSKMQPLMQEIKEKYPDDPQKQQMETMKIYKEYDINPMGGCLPMFAQIPIFFGFYSMLRHAVELRGEKFMWVEDLSMPDTLFEIPVPFALPFVGNDVPINLLPILMMATMFLQMQLSPKTGDPMQRRIFMFMPFMFFFFCYNFASALALYWTAQNIFSIGQTWWMQKQPDVELKKKKPGKKSFMEKLAAKAEEAQRLQKEGKRPGQQAKAASKKPKKPRGPKTGG